MTASSRDRAVWITWESQPRNRSMARELGIPLHEFCYAGRRLTRHLKSLGATLRLLWRERPSVVFASNPSLVLTLVLLACRPVFGFRFATDAHYGGVVAVHGGRWMQRLLDFANRRADIVIVTNMGHADRVRGIGGTPFVCPDPLPHIPASTSRPSGMNGVRKSVLFICSYELDEPFPAVFEAARELDAHGFTVFASGSYQRAGISPETTPHVVLLGYVDRTTYDAYLRHVDVVLDLTTWEDCLVCGAYEAMAVGKPCVLSPSPALTGLFTHGTVFSAHDPSAIVQAVRTAYHERDRLRKEIADWTVHHEAATRARASALRTALGLPAQI